MKKHLTITFIILFSFFLVTACTVSPESDSSASVQPDSDLASLYQEIDNSGHHVGIAYIGYAGYDMTQNELSDFIRNSQLAEKYDFLCDAPVVSAGGAELYAVVSVDKNSTVNIFPAEPNERGQYDIQSSDALYSAGGAGCFILRCNMSEIHSNVCIMITSGNEKSAVYPMLSGMDGHISSENCYDFSIYPADE